MKSTGWIIQLRSPEEGERYYTSRGNQVTTDRNKAKVFPSKEEAEKKMKEATLWENRKVITCEEES